MSRTVIKVENVSKQYRLGQVGTGSLAHDLNRVWHKVRGKEDPYLKIGEENERTIKGNSEYVWAIQDINFQVKQGEVLGIIGKNGAGKSTLLKMLSRTTLPSTGSIKVRGRIASLLEVGTGFHPELTGRENIFLNGAILGMTRQEITKNFDAIVDFSGVEKYIDTPVKRYSSGMYVRLAFAVAAHLEPEILIVDEVLAVGDAEFQKKCIGKMKDVSVNEGRTVLFVSHNMAAVKQLCSSGIVLKNGRSVFSGTQNEAVAFYQMSGNSPSSFEHDGSIETAPGNNNIKILKFRTSPLAGDVISISSGVAFELTFFNSNPDINLDITFELKTLDDIVVFHNGTLISQSRDSKKGFYTVKGVLQPYFLNSGIYKFKVLFGQDQRYLLYTDEDTLQFEVMNEMKGSNAAQLPGVVFIKIPFDVKFSLQ
jgi:lipopolysaccharide transport system ATP-binding protein